LEPIRVRKHSTASHEFQLKDGDADGDLTGKTVHLVLKKAASVVDYNTTDDASNLTKTDAGVVTFTPADGEWDSDVRVDAYFWVSSGTMYKEYPGDEEIVFIVRDFATYDPANPPA